MEKNIVQCPYNIYDTNACVEEDEMTILIPSCVDQHLEMLSSHIKAIPVVEFSIEEHKIFG